MEMYHMGGGEAGRKAETRKELEESRKEGMGGETGRERKGRGREKSPKIVQLRY